MFHARVGDTADPNRTLNPSGYVPWGVKHRIKGVRLHWDINVSTLSVLPSFGRVKPEISRVKMFRSVGECQVRNQGNIDWPSLDVQNGQSS